MPIQSNAQMLQDNGSGQGTGVPRKVTLVYDPKTGQWVPATATNNSGTTNSNNDSPNSSNNAPAGSDTKSVGDSKNVDSKKEADKQYIEAEFNVLTGEMSLTPTSKSIRIKVNDTVRVEGLGKYLSGLYFVSAISRTISKDSGYAHSFTLIKNGFGDSLKKAQPSSEPETRKEEVPKSASELKVNDTIKIVGDDAVYSNAHNGVRVPAWVKKKTLVVQQVSEDESRVLLMPINSWTYARFTQKQ